MKPSKKRGKRTLKTGLSRKVLVEFAKVVLAGITGFSSGLASQLNKPAPPQQSPTVVIINGKGNVSERGSERNAGAGKPPPRGYQAIFMTAESVKSVDFAVLGDQFDPIQELLKQGTSLILDPSDLIYEPTKLPNLDSLDLIYQTYAGLSLGMRLDKAAVKANLQNVIDSDLMGAWEFIDKVHEIKIVEQPFERQLETNK